MARLGIWVLMCCVLGCAQEPSRALKVATNQWLGYEPLFLARYIGAYEHNVDIVQLPSATDVMRAMRNGSVDVVATTLDEALLLASQGEDLVVLMALDFSSGADVVLGRPPLASLNDIKGRRVGVENTGLGAVMLSAALEHAGIKVDDITLVNIPADEHQRAYRANDVDAIVTFEPTATQLRQAGANLLFDSSAIPNLIVDVLVARRSLLQNRREALNDLVAGYYKARSYMLTRSNEAYGFIGKRLKLTPEQLQLAYAGLRLPTLQDNIRWLAGSPSAFDVARDHLQQLMQEQRLLDQSESGRLEADGRWLAQVPR